MTNLRDFILALPEDCEPVVPFTATDAEGRVLAVHAVLERTAVVSEGEGERELLRLDLVQLEPGLEPAVQPLSAARLAARAQAARGRSHSMERWAW